MTTRAVVRVIQKIVILMRTTALRIATIVRLPICTTIRSSSPRKQEKNLPNISPATKMRTQKHL